MRKEPWRCATWDEVKRRAACIDILAQFRPRETDGGVSGPKGADGRRKEVATPCTTPRTLELYCGRAGYSSHQKRMGNDAFFLDYNRAYVERSFAEKPEHDEGGQVRHNRLCLCPWCLENLFD